MLRVALALVLSAFAGPCLADGKVFPRVAEAARIPGQQALIHYADGVQTLVIETRFEGTGSEFAWLVPLPASPEIEPVTTGLFPTLRSVFAPAVIDRDPIVLVPALWAFIGILAFLAGWRIFIPYLVLTLAALIFALPSLGRVRGAAESNTTVQVLSRDVVGSYDAAVITGSGASDILAWLTDHGFEAPPSAAPVIQSCIADGWVFSAVRLRRDESSAATLTPHPLAFRFPTQRPVYPLRLTALDGGPLTVDLYVFGPGRARADGFTVKRCARPSWIPVPGPPRPHEDVRLVHPELVRLVPAAAVGTLLTATLTTDQMARDSYIDWEEFSPSGATVYGPAGAASVALDTASLALAILTALMALALRIMGKDPVAGIGWLLVPLLLSAVTWSVMYLAIPHVRVVRAPIGRLIRVHDHVAMEVSQTLWREPTDAEPPPAFDDIRRRVRASVTEVAARYGVDPPREEDSPYNYTLRLAVFGAEYVWYSGDGAPIVRPLIAR